MASSSSNNSRNSRLNARSLIAAAAVAALAGAAALLYGVNPAGSPLYPKCPFYMLTGFHCPGCGSLRAAHQLLHGHWVAAFRMNPLALVLVPVVIFSSAWRMAEQRLLGRQVRPLSARWIWLLLAVMLIFTVLRNVPVYPFTLLAPTPA